MTYRTNLEQERRMLFCLNQIQQLGAVSICSLGEYFGSYSNLFNIEETDIILEGEMKFFVWVSKERWGFVVLPILRDQEELYKGAETFFDFEDDTWELNFFDGRK